MDTRDRFASRAGKDPAKRISQNNSFSTKEYVLPSATSKQSPARPARPRSLTSKPPPPPPIGSHRRTASLAVAPSTVRETQNQVTPVPRSARKDNNTVPVVPPKPLKLLADRARIRDSIYARNQAVKAAVEKKTNLLNGDAVKLARKGTPAVITTSSPPSLAALPSQEAFLDRSDKQPQVERGHTSFITPVASLSHGTLQLSEASCIINNSNLSPRPSRPQNPHEPSPSSPHLDSRRRSPARFSSNGVATSSGPPPSLAYRRRLSMDNRAQVPDVLSEALANSEGIMSTIALEYFQTEGINDKESGDQSSTPNVMPDDEDQDRKGYNDIYGEGVRTIRGLEDLRDETPLADADVGQDAEDVFLKLAQASGRSEKLEHRRRVRLSQYAQRNSLPPDIMSSPLAQIQTHEISSPPSEAPDDTWGRNLHLSSPIGGYHNRQMFTTLEQRADRAAPTPRPAYPRPMSMLRREGSRSPAGHSRSMTPAEPSSRTPLQMTARPLHVSLGLDTDPMTPVHDRNFTSAPHSQPEFECHGQPDSASTVSTTAASSVWDELDDLKSRIRRLEITGRMPASGVGAGSNSSGDRPRTATTTATTLSSSPRRGGVSTYSAPANLVPNVLLSTSQHPLLTAALSKAKPLISAEVFKHLELASKDALSLSDTIGAPATGTPLTVGNDRHVRRKVDSMCRSLTELCIALTENRHGLLPVISSYSTLVQPKFPSRPGSRDRSHGKDSVLGGRESSLGAGRSTVLGNRDGHFADRKRSSASLSAASAYGSPRTHRLEETLHSPITNTSGTVRQSNSMVISRAELVGSERYRAPSRATTEIIARSRRIAATRDQANDRTPIDRTTVVRRHHAINSQLSPNVQQSTRRFLSATMDHRDRVDSMVPGVELDRQMSREPSFDSIGGAPISGRLLGDVAADPNYSSPIDRSGSHGRASGGRAVRRLRESIDLDCGGGVSFSQNQASATERLLNRR